MVKLNFNLLFYSRWPSSITVFRCHRRCTLLQLWVRCKNCISGLYPYHGYWLVVMPIVFLFYRFEIQSIQRWYGIMSFFLCYSTSEINRARANMSCSHNKNKTPTRSIRIKKKKLHAHLLHFKPTRTQHISTSVFFSFATIRMSFF